MKLVQYQEIAFVAFTPSSPPAETASMTTLQVMPSGRLSPDLYQQFVGPVFPVPAEQDAFVALSWRPRFPDYFPALRMVQTEFGQFVPPVMTPPIPPGGSGMNGYVVTFIPTNALPIG